jgi:hypothetical protein
MTLQTIFEINCHLRLFKFPVKVGIEESIVNALAV